MADATKTLQIIISAQDEASAAIRSTSGALEMMGSVLGALGLANLTYDLINLGKAAFNTGYQFNVMAENIQGNTGMSDAQIKMMEADVMSLAQQSGIASEDIMNSFQFAYDTTGNFNASLAMTTAAMEAVRIHGGDMSEAVKILSTVMHDYGQSNDQATATMSKITAIAQQSKATFSDLDQQFTVFIATAASANVPLDQAGALFDALTKKLGDANRASTEGLQFMLALEAAHKSVKAAIGDTTAAVTTSTKAHKDYSDQIAVDTDRIKAEEDRLHSMKTATTAQKDSYQSLTDTIKSHQDALTALDAKQAGVATTAMSKVDPALRGLAADFTDTGIKAKGIYGILEDINNAAGGNTAELQKLFPNYRSLYAAMSLTSDKGVDVKTSLEGIDKASAQSFTAQYQERLGKVDSQWGMLSETLKNRAIVAFDELAPAIDVALKYLNWEQGQTPDQKWAELGRAVKGTFDDIKTASAPAISQLQVVGKLFQDFLSGGDPTLTSSQAKNPFFMALVTGMDTVRAKLQDMQGWFLAIPGKIQQGFTTAQTITENFINRVTTYFSELPGKVDAYFIDLFEKRIPFDIGFAAGYLSVAIPKLISDIGKWFQTLPGTLDKIMQNTYQNVIKWFNKVHTDTVASTTKSVNDTEASMKQLPPKMEAILMDNYNRVIKWLTATWAWTANEVSQWPGRIEKLLDTIPGIVDTILKSLNKTVDDDLKAVWNTATSWWNQVKDIFQNIINAANTALHAAQSGFAAGVNVAHRAGGGWAGGLTLAGEAGPELVNLPTGSYVHNSTQTQNMLGGSDVTIQFNGGVQLDSPDRVQQLANQIIRIIGRQNELARKGYSV